MDIDSKTVLLFGRLCGTLGYMYHTPTTSAFIVRLHLSSPATVPFRIPHWVSRRKFQIDSRFPKKKSINRKNTVPRTRRSVSDVALVGDVSRFFRDGKHERAEPRPSRLRFYGNYGDPDVFPGPVFRRFYSLSKQLRKRFSVLDIISPENIQKIRPPRETY